MLYWRRRCEPTSWLPLAVAFLSCGRRTDMLKVFLSGKAEVKQNGTPVEQGWAAGRVTRHHALRLWHLMPGVVQSANPGTSAARWNCPRWWRSSA